MKLIKSWLRPIKAKGGGVGLCFDKPQPILGLNVHINSRSSYLPQTWSSNDQRPAVVRGSSECELVLPGDLQGRFNKLHAHSVNRRISGVLVHVLEDLDPKQLLDHIFITSNVSKTQHLLTYASPSAVAEKGRMTSLRIIINAWWTSYRKEVGRGIKAWEFFRYFFFGGRGDIRVLLIMSPCPSKQIDNHNEM